MEPILRVAAKACIINDEGKVLIVREAASKDTTQVGKWGLPGGRLEPGESFTDGLQREVREETGLQVTIGKPLYVGEWRPVIRGVPHQIIAIFMVCKVKSGDVQLSDEHDQYKWISPAKRANYTVMPPDDLVIDAFAAL